MQPYTSHSIISLFMHLIFLTFFLATRENCHFAKKIAHFALFSSLSNNYEDEANSQSLVHDITIKAGEKISVNLTNGKKSEEKSTLLFCTGKKKLNRCDFFILLWVV